MAQARGSSLYVGGLNARVCTELLHDVFSLAGTVTLCRVVSDKHTGASLGFGFVDYADADAAAAAKSLLNGRVLYSSELTVDWAHASSGAAGGAASRDTPAGAAAAPDISNHYCLFIGNLAATATDEDLRKAFSAFGEVSSAAVSRDSGGESRRCAFVSFRERSAAQAAIDEMHGQSIADRPMRVDWARTKTNAATRAAALGLPETDRAAATTSSAPAGRSQLDFAAVAGQTPPGFTTAYVSGLPPDVSDQVLREAFGGHGEIADVRIPESARAHGGDKLYAFVVYADHDSAARAICSAQGGLVVAGRPVTVQWGRESSSRTPGAGAAGGPRGMGAIGGVDGSMGGMGPRGMAPRAGVGYGTGYGHLPSAPMGFNGAPHGMGGYGYAQHSHAPPAYAAVAAGMPPSHPPHAHAAPALRPPFAGNGAAHNGAGHAPPRQPY